MNRSKEVIILFTSFCESRKFHITFLKKYSKLLLIHFGNNNIPDWLKNSILQDIIINDNNASELIKETSEKLSTTITGIINLSETGVYICAKIAKELKLNHLPFETVSFVRNKLEMRKLFEFNKIPSVAYCSASNIDQAILVQIKLATH